MNTGLLIATLWLTGVIVYAAFQVAKFVDTSRLEDMREDRFRAAQLSGKHEAFEAFHEWDREFRERHGLGHGKPKS